MSTWSLVSLLTDDGPGPRVAASAAGRLTSVPPLQGYADLADVLTAWSAVEPLLRSFDPADGVPLAGTVLAPVRSPHKLICAGANYVDHLREMGIPQLPSGLEPYFFLLPPTSIAGPDDVVVIPTDPGARVDWEAELAVVIGTPGRDISERDALDHVAGYTIMNDISARGYHGRKNPLAPPSPTTGWPARAATRSPRSARASRPPGSWRIRRICRSSCGATAIWSRTAAPGT